MIESFFANEAHLNLGTIRPSRFVLLDLIGGSGGRGVGGGGEGGGGRVARATLHDWTVPFILRITVGYCRIL